MSMLEIENLHVEYRTDDAIIQAVNGISFSVEKGEIFGLVGETGAGKSTVALSILKIIPDPPGVISQGSIKFEGQDVVQLSDVEMQKYRGNKMSMIFQDPMTALNPVLTVIDQIAEVIQQHKKVSSAEAEEEAIKMLEMVGIGSERAHEYPHQFSGGMKQRVLIAIALACNPELLIADEPTTALDVTIQAQILNMMYQLKQELGTAIILITHDLGVVAEMCDKVAVMYAGEIVEIGTLEHIFNNPLHPYTNGLFDSIPSLDSKVSRLKPIPGLMPDPANLPVGCPFMERCSSATPECALARPETKEVEPGHLVKCIKYK